MDEPHSRKKQIGKSSSSLSSSGKRKQFQIFDMKGFTPSQKKRPGIKNVGYTCWLISTLQGQATLKKVDLQGTDAVSKSTQPVLQSLKTAVRGTECISIEELKSKSGKEEFGLVPIEIPMKDVVTVTDCLDEFQTQELLHGANAVFCDLCGVKQSHLKHYEFSNSGSRCLILQLKRYVRGKTGRLQKRLLSLGSNLKRIYRLVAVQVENPFSKHKQNGVEGEEKNILRSLLQCPQQCHVGTHHRIQLKAEDLRRLDDGGWLNDQIVNLYFKLIEKMCPYLSVVDVFFYTSIKNTEDANKFLREDAFNRDKILIPVQCDNHWCLVVLDVDDRSVKLFDSSTSRNQCLHIIRTFLETSNTCPSGWRIEKVKDLPKQQNANDCGIFMCQFAVNQAFGIDIQFTQNNIPEVRQAMKVECLTGQLLNRFG